MSGPDGADPTGSGAVGHPGRRQRHEAWMRRALAVAADDGRPAELGDPADDVPVGAVLYGPDGAELAIGRNERERAGDPTAHAEILALRRAAALRGAWRLDGCTLVVTLEPCTMCAGALVLARISTLVFGAWEPKTGAVGSLWDVVRDRRLNHRPEVYGGVLAEESAALLRSFFR
ncbi:nucleoside deaminase [Micromonospora sp. NBC_01796]|uniref:nucleoside deaminase n=1 Tax=Micromonospora sp. NBC_01796 TaxID=2975987 RepID=UPI002DD8FC05|nr:nucleoside deaminase [Micromonospora sp. NBC_01796]